MADIPDDLKTELAKLSPDARTRVEAALKGTIEQGLAAGSRGPGMPAASFSRGVLFSKSVDRMRLDDEILPALSQMDDAKFNAFVDRISTLKGGKAPGS